MASTRKQAIKSLFLTLDLGEYILYKLALLDITACKIDDPHNYENCLLVGILRVEL
jgi:hypothetical protein